MTGERWLDEWRCEFCGKGAYEDHSHVLLLKDGKVVGYE